MSAINIKVPLGIVEIFLNCGLLDLSASVLEKATYEGTGQIGLVKAL